MQPALSYVNFLILNNIVIAQNYWEEGRPESIRERDKQALAVLQEVFPDRKIVPFVSTALRRCALRHKECGKGVQVGRMRLKR